MQGIWNVLTISCARTTERKTYTLSSCVRYLFSGCPALKSSNGRRVTIGRMFLLKYCLKVQRDAFLFSSNGNFPMLDWWKNTEYHVNVNLLNQMLNRKGSRSHAEKKSYLHIFIKYFFKILYWRSLSSNLSQFSLVTFFTLMRHRNTKRYSNKRTQK